MRPSSACNLSGASAQICNKKWAIDAIASIGTPHARRAPMSYRRSPSLVFAFAAILQVACSGSAHSVEDESVGRDIPTNVAQPDADAGATPTVSELSDAGEKDTGAAQSVDGGSPDAADGSAPDGSATPDGGAAVGSSCALAKDIGIVSGDSSSASVSVQGSCKTWVRVRVTEDIASVVGRTLSVRATLTSSTSTDYNLFSWFNKDVDVVECTISSNLSMEPSGIADVVNLGWGEPDVANNLDDSRWVSFLIKEGSGTCDPTKTWTLVIEGNR